MNWPFTRSIPKHEYSLWYGDILKDVTSHSRTKRESVTWISSDTKENYASLPPGITDYTPESFDYKLNARGFRCDELEDVANIHLIAKKPWYVIAFSGCSLTFGVGIPQEDTWAYRVIQRLRNDFPHAYFPYLNLAKGGRSLDYIVRTYQLAIDRIRIDLMIPLVPIQDRAELCIEKSRIHDYVEKRQGNLSDVALQVDSVYRQTFADNDYWNLYRLQKNFRYLELLSKAHHVDLLWASWQGDLPDWLPPKAKDTHLGVQFTSESITGKMGRDGIHPEPAVHERFVEQVYPRIRDTVSKQLTLVRDYL
jgi:hypothetical protein